MSISSEITSMGENLKKDYQSIANLGADLTGVDKNIENIAELLDGVYDRLPKTEFQTGTDVTIENGLKGKLDFDDGKVGFGQASQETTQGYNLAEVNTDNYTLEEDYIWTNKKNNSTGLTLFDEVQLTANTTYYVKFVILQKSTASASFTGYTDDVVNNNVSFGNIDNASYVIGQVYTKQYTPASNETLSVKLWGNTNSETIKFQYWVTTDNNKNTYEPYTNGASPNPSYPQEVKCVRGKNRFDIGTSLDDYFQTSTNGTKIGNTSVNVATATISNNKLTIDSYNTSGYNWISKWLNLEKNTNYVISGTNDSAIKIVGFTSNELQTTGTEIITKNTSDVSKTFNSGDYKYYCLSFYPSATGKYFENIQIEEGTTSTPYLPYNTIEEVVSGKNLIPNNWTSGSISSSTGGAVPYGSRIYTTNKIVVKPNTTYIINNNNTSTYNINNLVDQYDNNGNYINRIGTYLNGSTFITGSNAKYINISLNNTSDTMTYSIFQEYLGNGTLKPILAEGTDDTYEPYITPTSYQLSLGDIELCGIGDYKDELVYDVENDKVYKNEKIGKYTFTGNENMTYDSGSVRFVINDLVNNLEGSGRQQIYSNRYKFIASGSADYGMFAFYNIVHQIFIYNKDYTNPSDLLSYFANNNTYFYYIRNNLNKIEITGTLKDQVKALYNAHSLNGTTIITSNGDLPMIIKVRGLKGE